MGVAKLKEVPPLPASAKSTHNYGFALAGGGGAFPFNFATPMGSTRGHILEINIVLLPVRVSDVLMNAGCGALQRVALSHEASGAFIPVFYDALTPFTSDR